MNKKGFKSGFVTILGRPNVGKSTLMNQLVGQKVAIMTDKAQTTRNRIQAIYTDNEAQVIFVDTPGIHKPKHALGEFMVQTAFASLKGVDAIFVVVNATEPIGPGDRLVIDSIREANVPVFLLINKIDLIHPDALFGIIASYQSEYAFQEIFPISAKTGRNLDSLMTNLKAILPEGPMYYPKDHITDHPEYFIVAELIREKILYFTREEVPHSVAVNVNRMRHNEEGRLEIEATILVERDSQKGIIIGKHGDLIKKVKQLARRDIEKLLGEKVSMEVWVKVQKRWRDRQSQLNELGYQQKDY